MKNLIRIIPVLVLLAMPVFAHAQTSNTNININDLIAQTQALIAQINALKAQQGGTPSTVSSGTPSMPIACPVLTRALSMGSKGTDVSSLQTFLAQDPSVYPEAMVTGYFGPLTEKAVQRWQAKYGVVSSGTPDSTGFGVVGPKTRAAMQSRCAAGAPGGTSSQSGGVVGGYLQVTPATGPAPLNTAVNAIVNTGGSCAGGTYVVDFGDNTPVRQIVVPVGTCGQMNQIFPHIYQNTGTYVVTLGLGVHKTSSTVTVSGPTMTDTLQATASSSVPLAVTFTGTVLSADAGTCTSNCVNRLNFGDGTSVDIPLPNKIAGADSYTTYTVTHTYATDGTYTATLTTTPASGQVRTVANTSITVSGVNPTAPAITMNVTLNDIKQDGILPVSWTSKNAPVSSAVALWMVNIQAGTIYTLATSLSPTGSLNVPISSAPGDGSMPPAGLYTIYAKLYTPSDAVLTKTTPTYIATAQSGVLTVKTTAGTTATSTAATSTTTYSIGAVTVGVGSNPLTVSAEVLVPKCPSYTFDWGDSTMPIIKTAPVGCGTSASSENPLSTHTYAAKGTYTLALTPAGGDSITKTITVGATSSATSTTQTATSTPSAGTKVPTAGTATMTVSVGVSTINQAGSLPITWTSQNAPPSSAVVLWLVNVQTNTFTPLATTLSTNGNVTLPVSGSTGGASPMGAPAVVPPPGTYTVVSKLYTPADALVTGGSATFLATAQASTFTITLGTTSPSTGPVVPGPTTPVTPTPTTPTTPGTATTTPATVPTSTGGYSITVLGDSGVKSGTPGAKSSVLVEVLLPTCAGYTVDWGDGSDTKKSAPSGACGASNPQSVTHTYAHNGFYTISLKDASGVVKATTPAAVYDTFASSVLVATSTEAFVQYLYKCILGRQDTGGTGTAYIKSLPAGTSLLAVYNIFFDSAEYKGLKTTNEKYVEQLYECVLFRKAEDAGKQFWVNSLSSGSSRLTLLTSFIASVEFQEGIGVVLQQVTGFFK